jgi:hypothetical protein
MVALAAARWWQRPRCPRRRWPRQWWPRSFPLGGACCGRSDGAAFSGGGPAANMLTLRVRELYYFNNSSYLMYAPRLSVDREAQRRVMNATSPTKGRRALRKDDGLCRRRNRRRDDRPVAGHKRGPSAGTRKLYGVDWATLRKYQPSTTFSRCLRSPARQPKFGR